jgi:CheY-like chemotaxis protein
MGGRLDVESELGQGSAFHFTLSLPIAENRPDSEPALEASVLKGKAVLIVDDNATNRRILEEHARRWGMVSESVDGGQAALEAMSRARTAGRPFQLVLLDFQMPDMDGFEVAEAIRKRPEFAASTIMMLSSAGQRGDVARCREVGAAAYLTKPVRRSVLLEAILKILSDGAAPSTDKPAVVTRHSIGESRGELRVLVAEDNPVNLKVVEGMLRKHGCVVTAALTGRRAVEALEREKFDLVFMDVQMPEMDGLEATREIRRREQASGGRVPIVGLTAHAMRGDKERCLDSGMDGYLTKPIKPDLLIQAIEEALLQSAETATTARPDAA